MVYKASDVFREEGRQREEITGKKQDTAAGGVPSFFCYREGQKIRAPEAVLRRVLLFIYGTVGN